LTSDTIVEGDYILLYVGPRKTYLVKAEASKSFHTHKGFVNLNDIVGKAYGSRIRSSLGFEFVALKPQLRDYIMKSARQTQITYPKDIALIVMFSGVGPGSRVVEAGTGTAALTLALAHYVKPNGKVYSYEVRSEFLEIAEKNLNRAGLCELVELKTKDITEGIDETGMDAVVLDLAVPWLVIPHASSALGASGALVSFSPTIDQVVRTVEALRDNSFFDIETVECLMRGMQVERGKTRPQTLMTAHTGYVTYARKAITDRI
jgi:tRNA (adenine57-N1/adenine58-N1)-methyltransferase